MKYRLLELLICPECAGRLTLSPEPGMVRRPAPGLNKPSLVCSRFCGLLNQPLPPAPGHSIPDCDQCYRQEVMAGSLRCDKGHDYRIEDGVPILIPGPLSGRGAKTAKAFGYEWLRYRVELAQEERKIFLAETLCEPEEFAGRLVLDAGCGMGRFTRIAAELGAELVGIDLSPAVQAVFAETARLPRLHVIRGDLTRPPLRPGSFDLVYSLGVLHHTPDTRTALQAVVPLARSGGTIAFWVYGRAGDYRNFLTNPLEATRAAFFKAHPRLHRPYWRLLKVREKISDALRIIATRLPAAVLYSLCLALVPFGAIPGIKYFTFSAHPNWRVRRQENFDWLSPPFQFKHTKEEIREWIAELGLIEEKMLSHGLVPKIGFKVKKK